ncbi:hypothetical protein [Spirosoma agri]|uniref:Uncharacterized protein n=1 Tax=Spirosoma agri TaxID=1987381 RepID=A0A6M0IHC3_9BACT|nr:hypothetical protein [Spirosoma agri]NEU67095.1 hypothetical protein [Spirosoma agri]
MAADGTSIKNEIDNDLANKGYRGIRIATIITTLKKVVDWVTGAVNGNLSTWLKTSDNQPGGANADDVYRTGITRFKGGIEAYTRNPDNKVLAQTAYDQGAIRINAQNGGPAYVELHHPGNRIDKLGTDPDGVLKFVPWGATIAYTLFISGLTPLLAFSSVLARRKIVLYQGAPNDYQFYGFGIEGGKLVYSVNSEADAHVFVAGSSPITSVELMRIAGNGNVSIGDTTSAFRLKAVDNNPGNGWIIVVSNSRTTTGRTGAKILFDQSNLASWAIGQPGGDVNAFVIESSGNTERVRVDSAGNVGIGTSAPTARLHAKGATGYDQLRLENKYTPSGPGDPNGQAGAFAWDDTWFYLKTTAGWRRIQLQSW